jgi:hypothetical protein
MNTDTKILRPKWKGTLTDRERFNRQMHFKSVDRCFNREFGYWNENFIQWAMFRDNGIVDNEQADVALNFDRMLEIYPTRWLNPTFETKTVSETAGTRLIQNEEGLLAEVPADRHDTIPHFIASPIKEPGDWKRYKEEHLRRDDPARRVDPDRIADKNPKGRDYPLGVYCGSMIGKVRDILTVEGLAYHIYDYPEMVEDMVETCCVLTEDFLDQVLPLGDFDFASGWEDICYNRGPLVGLDFFKNVVVPRYRRITKKLRQHGIDIYYTDCDGDIRLIIPLLLESGINTMFPLEVNGSGNPMDILAKYEGQIRIMGGVDKMVMAQGPGPIRAYLEKLRPWVEKGGFIPHCDHRCPPNVTQEDYLYYLKVKEELFGM